MAERIARKYVEAVPDERDDSWMMRASCAAQPGLMDATTAPEVFDALAVCATCPVVQQCRAWANTEEHFIGVAGGKVYTDRVRGKTVPPRAYRPRATGGVA